MNDKERDRVSNVEKEAKRRHAEIIYCDIVEKFHQTSSGSDKRVLLITDQFIAFYKVSSRVSLCRLDYWVDLREVEVESDVTSLFFALSGDFTFASPEWKTIQNKLGDLLQRYCTVFETQQIHVNCLTDNRVCQSRRGLMARFRSYLASEQFHIKEQTNDYIMSLLMVKCPSLVIPTFEDLAKLENALIYTLNGFSEIESITFTGCKGSKLFEILASPDIFPFQFNHLHFDSVKISNFYGDWLYMLIADSNCTLKGLTFSNVSFKDKELLGLQQVIIDRKMTSLGFNKSIKSKGYDTLVSKFLIPAVVSSLQLLTFDNMIGLPYEKLIYKVKDVYALSLAGCKLDVYEVLKCVKNTNMYRLRFLNLSGNKAAAPSDRSVSFTDNLQRLDLCGVEWSDGSLVPVLSSAAAHKWLGVFELNLSRANVSQTEWGACKLFMANHKRSFISSLIWNYNPVWPELIQFIEESAHMVTLEISNSFTKYDSTVMNRLGNFIKKCETLTSLTIYSDEHHDLGESLVSLIQCTLECEPLQNIVVTGNKIGDQGVRLLGDLVKKNSTLRSVWFDGSGMTGINILTEFIDKCKATKRQIVVEWPEKDTSRLASSGNIPSDKLDQVKGSLMQLYYSPGQETYDNNPMTRPFEVFQYAPQSFPLYVSAALGEYFNSPLKSFECAVTSPRKSPDLSQRRKSAMTIEVGDHPQSPSHRIRVDAEEKSVSPRCANRTSFDSDEDISPRRARRRSVKTDDSCGSPRKSGRTSPRRRSIATSSDDDTGHRRSSSFDDDEPSPRRRSRRKSSREDDSYLCPNSEKRRCSGFPIGSPSRNEHREVMSKLKIQFSLENLGDLLAEEYSL